MKQAEIVTMKSFIVGLALAIVTAVAAGFILEGNFAQKAEHAFATSSVRVGHESTVEARQFSGPGREG